MKFFNPKEQVVDFQLTQYGKFLLSKGKLRPVYYAFFDDNVLYDSQYGGFSEHQNNPETRIKENTPYLETQYIYSGIETNIKNINNLVRSGKVNIGDDKIQPTSDKHYSLVAPLGNSEIGKQQSPYIKMKYLYGNLTSSVEYMTGSHQTLKIPQLDSDIIFKTTIGISNNIEQDSEREQNDVVPAVNFEGENKYFDDGTYIRVEDDYVLLEVEEENTQYLKQNFDIEVYRVENIPESSTNHSGSFEMLIPLSFVKKEKIDEFVLNTEELGLQVPEIDPSFVEYYFDIFVDNEIDPDIMNKTKKDKKKNLYSDEVFDVEGKYRKDDTYKSLIDKIDDLEECD